MLLVGLNYLNAWTGPPANPPRNNVEAPINTSSNSQDKNGGLGVTTLVANEVQSSLVKAISPESEVWADKYCNENGENCSDSTGTGSEIDFGGSGYLGQVGGGGGGTVVKTCPDGSVLTGASINAGRYVDGINLICTKIDGTSYTQTYSWSYGAWGACSGPSSNQCRAIGVRYQSIICKMDGAGTRVGTSRCDSSTRPEIPSQACMYTGNLNNCR